MEAWGTNFKLKQQCHIAPACRHGLRRESMIHCLWRNNRCRRRHACSPVVVAGWQRRTQILVAACTAASCAMSEAPWHQQIQATPPRERVAKSCTLTRQKHCSTAGRLDIPLLSDGRRIEIMSRRAQTSGLVSMSASTSVLQYALDIALYV
jgi:hypothetical protein